MENEKQSEDEKQSDKFVQEMLRKIKLSLQEKLTNEQALEDIDKMFKTSHPNVKTLYTNDFAFVYHGAQIIRQFGKQRIELTNKVTSKLTGYMKSGTDLDSERLSEVYSMFYKLYSTDYLAYCLAIKISDVSKALSKEIYEWEYEDHYVN